jgi:phage gp46-like protein
VERALDPATGDYSGEIIDHLGNAVYLRLMTPLGGWWADPTLGSRLHELAREKDVERVRVLAVQYSRQALQPLIDDGRADSVDVVAVRNQPGRLALGIEVAQGVARRLFEITVKVA